MADNLGSKYIPAILSTDKGFAYAEDTAFTFNDGWLDQGVTTTSSPTFTTVMLTNLTDTYIPYHVSDTIGLANSIMTTGATGVTIGTAATGVDYNLTFHGESNTGILTWQEDEDRFQYSDDIFMYDARKISFRDAYAFIYSSDAWTLALVGSTAITLNTPTIHLGRNVDEDTTLNFLGATNDGSFAWMEDEDYFLFSDSLLMGVTARTYFRDVDIYVNSNDDGHLDLTADTQIDLNAATLATDKIIFTQTDGNEYIDSLNDGYMDYGATTAHRLHGPRVTVYGDLYIGSNEAVDYALVFDGESHDGQLTWMEDEDYLQFEDDMRLVGGENIILDTATGTKIGTATNQLLGFYNAVPVDQPAAVADATGAGDVVAQLNALLARLRELGLIAT